MNLDRIGGEAMLYARLREFVQDTHGVVDVSQLLDLGYSRKMIRNRTRSGKLIPVLRRVFTLPGTTLTARGRWYASTLSSGSGGCLSHRSALALHGLVRDRGQVHVLRLGGAARAQGSRVRSSREFGFSVLCHQTRLLPDEHITEVDGIRVTTIERALRDFSATATEGEMVKALSQGEREQSICWTTLRELVSTANGQKGTGRLRREIDRWDPAFADARSDPEEDFLLMIRRHDLSMPLVNVPLDPYVADFFWPSLGLVVELDPWGTHKGLESFERDHRKSVELEARGLRVIRFTWNDLYQHEDRTAAELRAILENRAGQGR